MKKRLVRFAVLLPLAWIFTVALVSCAGKSNSHAVQAGPPSAAADKSPAGSNRSTPTGGARTATQTAAPAAPAVNVGGTALVGTERLLPLSGKAVVLPEDYDIGRLAPPISDGTESSGVETTIQSFIEALSKGTVDRTLIAVQWRDDIQRLLSDPLAQHALPDSVRIGAITFTGSDADAPVRVFKGNDRTDGAIYLTRVGDSWLIDDVQIDFLKLLTPYKRSQEFDPADWQSLLKE